MHCIYFYSSGMHFNPELRETQSKLALAQEPSRGIAGIQTHSFQIRALTTEFPKPRKTMSCPAESHESNSSAPVISLTETALEKKSKAEVNSC